MPQVVPAEELMKMRAPNTSGVDTQAILRALSGQQFQPTSYAYGMNVQDAQREGQLAQQAAEQRLGTAQAFQKQAIAQDQQAFSNAMQAKGLELQMENARLQEAHRQHSRYIAERNLAINEQVKQAELAVKEAQLKGMDLQQSGLAMRNRLLELDIQRQEEMDKRTIKVGDEEYPMSFFNTPGGREFLKSKLGGGGNAASRKLSMRQEAFQQMGFSPVGAAYLSSINLEKTNSDIEKYLDKAEQALKGPAGNIVYPSTGTDEKGKPVRMTRDEWREAERAKLVREYYNFLPPEDLDKLLSGKLRAVQTLSGDKEESTPTPNQPLLSDTDIEELARALAPMFLNQ